MHGDMRVAEERPFPIVIVGHVDHGKSTLIGRLLHDANGLPETKLEEARQSSARRGIAFEWSFLIDALQLERNQGITLETSRVWFESKRRRYVIIDAPGHKQLLRNMVTGASSAEAAILVVDAVEGVSEQTRRHGYLLRMLGIASVVVAVNKMDLVGYDPKRFTAVVDDVRGYFRDIGVTPADIVPISARTGDGIVRSSTNMPWWSRPPLLDALDSLELGPSLADRPLRLAVQDVYRLGGRRVIVGRIAAGRLREGDPVRFHPGGTLSRIASFEGWPGVDRSITAAVARQSVAFALVDDTFVERGTIASAPDSPPHEAHVLTIKAFWLDTQPLFAGERLALRIATARHDVVVEKILHVIDIEDLDPVDATEVHTGAIARLVVRSRSKIVFDPIDRSRATGRGVLIRDYRVVGGCVVEQPAHSIGDRNLTAVSQAVAREERETANGHYGGVIWLTGLSGAGKSTLAMGLERRLFDRGFHALVLDADNVRLGVNRDLAFAPGDRRENIRRIAEMSRMLAAAGLVVVVACISPYRRDRAMARSIVSERFVEIFVKASLRACIARDRKGLYAKAERGEISDLTGVAAPYEVPQSPDFVVDTERSSIESALKSLVDVVISQLSRSDVRRHDLAEHRGQLTQRA